MLILGIETSCDETACAIVKDGVEELSSSLATSADLHQKTGGVVPEVAARKQVESIVPVIKDCLDKAGLKSTNIDALAVTVGPGLIGSLIVGVEAAKALSIVWNKPLIPVNHLVGHVYGNFVNNKDFEDIKFPFVALVVSGGHTDLILMRSHTDISFLGGTLDDAAGEAFDKTARLLGISSYLGGVDLARLAATCQRSSARGELPRPLLHAPSFDFSFSGLKTAVKNLAATDKHSAADLAAEFEDAVVEVLVTKTIKAAQATKVNTILLGGGVSANLKLRGQFEAKALETGLQVYYPPLSLCGDNAVYIASRAYFKSLPSSYIYPDLALIRPNPGLGIMDLV